MLNFITIVLAIIVAQVLLTAGVVAVLFNKKFMKAYTKWVMKMSKELMEDLYDFDEEEEL